MYPFSKTRSSLIRKLRTSYPGTSAWGFSTNNHPPAKHLFCAIQTGACFWLHFSNPIGLAAGYGWMACLAMAGDPWIQSR
jgi:hypothetical protein